MVAALLLGPQSDVRGWLRVPNHNHSPSKFGEAILDTEVLLFKKYI